jgi:7,8-dihydropterin-6-yl-methyl-4-(beta-D-ribofuranosyl)aminobenzene 5'-phosphate synthase
MRYRRPAVALVLIVLVCTKSYAEEARRITILYDAFGPASELVKDWGFAALVEYAGRRILFDTGNSAALF